MGQEEIWRRRQYGEGEKGFRGPPTPHSPRRTHISFGPGIPSPMPPPQHRDLVRQLL